MAWPSSSDFSEAVQNARLAFRDAELQSGQPELNHLGIPKPRSGGFAVVFKLRCGSKNWAVKCFTRDFSDQQQRYAAISNYLDKNRLPYTVGFRYLTDGVRVRGQMYPVLKMEWVEGENLREYVERHLNQPRALRFLAGRWLNMIGALRAASIAHGDLQDANIVIVRDEFRLIDYDGMFVPALSGCNSHEVGARHYQHPLRTERDFGSYLDNFSAWVIYLSLLALAAQPDLWRTFGGEVERLILRQQDYESPDRSAVLRTLENCPDHEVRSIARLFKSLLSLRPREIPILNRQLEVPVIGNPDARTSWLDDHVPHLREAASENPANVNGAPADRSWILDGMQREVLDHKACFERSPVLERVAIATSATGIAVSILLWQLSVFGYEVPAVVVILAAISNFISLRKGFLAEKSVQKAAELRAKRLRLASSRKTTEASLGESLREQERLRENVSAQATGTARGSEALKREEDEEIDAARTNCRLLLQGVDAKRIAAKRQLVDALAIGRRTFDTNVTDLDRQLHEVDFAEGQELANALKTSQLQQLQSVLSSFSISDTEIPKVGRSFRLRLVASGFKTAMDIDASVKDVAGIGPVRAAALKAWKADLEASARTTSLKTVATDNEAIVRAKFRHQRDWLKSERERCRLRLLHEERSERMRNRTYLDALANDEARLRKEMSAKEDEVRSAKAQQWDVLKFEQENVRRQREEELRKISEQISQLHKDLFRIKCDATNLDSGIEAIKDVRFSRYVARVFWSVK